MSLTKFSMMYLYIRSSYLQACLHVSIYIPINLHTCLPYLEKDQGSFSRSLQSLISKRIKDLSPRLYDQCKPSCNKKLSYQGNILMHV